MKSKINVCVVGLGRAGQIHLKSINSSDHFEFKYAVDSNPMVLNEISALYGCEPLTSIDRALADKELDAMIVSSPTDSHYEYICNSLKAGKHVFTEKPLGHSLTEVEYCFDLAAEKKLALHLGFQRRYDKNFIALKKSLSKVGNCRIVKTSSRDNPKPSLNYLKISGNIFHDMLIHDFDMLQFLFGAQLPESVFATGYAYDKEIKDIPDYDTVMVTLKYADGMMVSIDTSRISPYGYDQRIEVFGEYGMVCTENQPNNTVRIFDSEGTSRDPFNYSFAQRYKEAYVAELEQFATGIKEGHLTNVTKEECMTAHQIADAALESATKGLAVQLE